MKSKRAAGTREDILSAQWRVLEEGGPGRVESVLVDLSDDHVAHLKRTYGENFMSNKDAQIVILLVEVRHLRDVVDSLSWCDNLPPPAG